MRISKIFARSLFFVLFCNALMCAAAISRDQAEQNVKQLICNDSTVDASLNQVLKANSQRDIGWQVFEETDYYDVQRSVLVSKGVEFRYRWRVFQDGRIQPENERAAQLCRHEP